MILFDPDRLIRWDRFRARVYIFFGTYLFAFLCFIFVVDRLFIGTPYLYEDVLCPSSHSDCVVAFFTIIAMLIYLFALFSQLSRPSLFIADFLLIFLFLIAVTIPHFPDSAVEKYFVSMCKYIVRSTLSGYCRYVPLGDDDAIDILKERSRAYPVKSGAQFADNVLSSNIDISGLKSSRQVTDPAVLYISFDQLEKIIIRIVSSPTPEDLDFERDLIAIHNCYSSFPVANDVMRARFDMMMRAPPPASDNAVGNMSATAGVLHDNVRTSRYLAYLKSKGRECAQANSNGGLLACGLSLPTGDKSLGCADVKRMSRMR